MHRIQHTLNQALPATAAFALGYSTHAWRNQHRTQPNGNRAEEDAPTPKGRLEPNQWHSLRTPHENHTNRHQTGSKPAAWTATDQILKEMIAEGSADQTNQFGKYVSPNPKARAVALEKTPATDQFLEQLKMTLTPEQISTDPDDKELYGQDATSHNQPNPLAITFPRTNWEVQSIVKLANEHNIGIVPSGGRTGLSGGAVAKNGELVLCLDEMDNILDFSAEDRTVTCQAGVTTQTIQGFAKDNQLYYPVSFASQGASQIGGNIATNAGGVHVIRWGNTRDQVLGLKVVTPDGELLELDRNLTKDNAGYDLKQLFIGSEGTLGIIVEATMKLTTIPSDMRVTLLGIKDIQQVSQIKKSLQSNFNLTALELISSSALHHVQHDFDLSSLNINNHINNSVSDSEHNCVNDSVEEMANNRSTAPPYYLLIECADIKGAQAEKFDQLLADQKSSNIFTNYLSTSDEELSEKMWTIREGISSSLAEYKPIKYDVSVKPSLITDFVKELSAAMDKSDAQNRLSEQFQLVWFGHVGDGNLHLNFIPRNQQAPSSSQSAHSSQPSRAEKALTDTVLSLIKRYNGSPTAEHGTGNKKIEHMNYTHPAEVIDKMSELKSFFDPKDILNPGKMFDNRIPNKQSKKE